MIKYSEEEVFYRHRL